MSLVGTVITLFFSLEKETSDAAGDAVGRSSRTDAASHRFSVIDSIRMKEKKRSRRRVTGNGTTEGRETGTRVWWHATGDRSVGWPASLVLPASTSVYIISCEKRATESTARERQDGERELVSPSLQRGRQPASADAERR